MNFGSVSPSGLQLFASEHLIPPTATRLRNNSPFSANNANHNKYTKGRLRGLLELTDLSGWKGTGTGLFHNTERKSSGSNKNESSMPIIYSSSKNNNLNLSKDLVQYNNVPGRNYYGSNEDINQNCSVGKNNRTGIRNNTNNYNELLSNKCRVPDIQMINKYYGLIPKKFTVHSRQAADQSHRNSRQAQGRCKSAFVSVPNSRRKLHLGSSKSLDIPDDDEESNEPTVKVSVKLRRGNSLDMIKVSAPSDDIESEGGSNKSILVAVGKSNGATGPIAKKLPVEKQKKWRKSAILRSSSLSSMDDDDDRNCHANKKSLLLDNANTETQRVIKIDLNNMSWEESFQTCYSPSEEPQSTRESSPVPPSSSTSFFRGDKVLATHVFHGDDDDTIKGSENNTGIAWTTSVNSSATGISSNSESPLSLPNREGPSPYQNIRAVTVPARIGCVRSERESGESNTAERGGGDSGTCCCPINSSTQNVISDDDDDNGKRTTIGMSATFANGKEINGHECNVKCAPVDGETCNEMVGVGLPVSSMISSNSSAESRRARMRKTISFDEQILRPKDIQGTVAPGKQDPEGPKFKRPMTAASSRQSYPTPKAVPWTQKTGKNLSLSERRSKFQKSISVQSTSDSFDYGDGEGSDIETDNFSSKVSSPPAVPAFIPNPNSSFYKDTSRKPLFFQPAPEVSTMVAQISPIDNLEIQCEIEKVAIMLRNMQNQNKSFIDLTPAASSFPEGSHSTTHTGSFPQSNQNSKQKSRENTLSPIALKYKDTQDINGNPTGTNSSNANRIGMENNVPIDDKNTTSFPSSCSNIVLSNQHSPHQIPLISHVPYNTPTGKPLRLANNSQMTCDNLKPMPEESPNDSDCTMKTENPGQFFVVPKPPDTDTVETVIGEVDSGATEIHQFSHSANIPLSSSVSPQIAGTKRPPLKKSVSISCEKELYKTPGDHENEVNGNGNSSSKIENKSARPKTAVMLPSSKVSNKNGSSSSSVTPLMISQAQSTRSLNNSQLSKPSRSHSPSNRRVSSVPAATGIISTNFKEHDKNSNLNAENLQNGNGSSKSQASKNRKILIKKALIEINQSSSYMAKKWGTLGRPKTAPTANNIKNNSDGVGDNDKNKKSVTTVVGSCSGPSTSQRRQPLKASPPSVNGIKAGQAVGKPAILPGKREEKGEPSEGNGIEGETVMNKETGSEAERSGSRKTLHRQSFSLDEGLLLGFSNKEFGWDSRDAEQEPVPNKSETLFQNTKKREQCLKIYEKMLKTGVPVKLDTIFRGMMTPSEYRVFIRAAEDAARQAALEKEEAENAVAEDKDPLHETDAGVSSSNYSVSTEEVKV